MKNCKNEATLSLNTFGDTPNGISNRSSKAFEVAFMSMT